jgi:hypothetical protein
MAFLSLDIFVCIAKGIGLWPGCLDNYSKTLNYFSNYLLAFIKLSTSARKNGASILEYEVGVAH